MRLAPFGQVGSAVGPAGGAILKAAGAAIEGSPGALSPLGTVPWANFETRIAFAGTPAYVQVQALDATGKLIGTSPAVQPST